MAGRFAPVRILAIGAGGVGAAAAVDASDRVAITELARAERADAILNAVDPRFNPAVFEGAFEAGCTYLDMAMTPSDAERGVKLGHAQFAQTERPLPRSSCLRTAAGREPACSARKPSRPARSSSCWPTTARRTGSRIGRFST
jgi:hypothetical protein